jgi:hypothetical protein
MPATPSAYCGITRIAPEPFADVVRDRGHGPLLQG